mmetsp:Transcript_107544/g.343037  ORF Transcript_107544/g.343037 Transcript_107544/m.343037 type:complete len:760 (+) Transcript_107544:87-2366(+)
MARRGGAAVGSRRSFWTLYAVLFVLLLLYSLYFLCWVDATITPDRPGGGGKSWKAIASSIFASRRLGRSPDLARAQPPPLPLVASKSAALASPPYDIANFLEADPVGEQEALILHPGPAPQPAPPPPPPRPAPSPKAQQSSFESAPVGSASSAALASPEGAGGAAGQKIWHHCTGQGDRCVCPGTMRWGTKEKWLEVTPPKGKSVVDMECSIRNLEDIAPGDISKHCDCSVPPIMPKLPSKEDLMPVEKQNATQRIAEGKPFWMFCASQWQECTCEGKVRWGNKRTWMVIEPELGQTQITVKCSIKDLPDNVPGDDGKHCECWMFPNSAFFQRSNPGIRLISGAGDTQENSVLSCESLEADARSGTDCGAQMWSASEAFCSEAWTPQANANAGARAMTFESMRQLMRVWVEPRFRGNYDRLYNKSGWIERAFVNYYAGIPAGRHTRMTEELVRSVHLFSSTPIVVVHFGFTTAESWTPEEFPRLVLLNAAPIPVTAGRSFNFNKLRAMMLSRAVVGVQLDSDQFVAPGVDRVFQRTAEEVTKDYPMPILPAHFLDWGPSGEGPGGVGALLWNRYCPAMKEGKCKWQTQRWGHAHPTWTFWATPFLGRWLRRNFRDESLPDEGPKKGLRVIDVKEDEDLLNVGTWEEGGTKQWCKFDMTDPTEFDTLFKKQSSDNAGNKKCIAGMCGDVTGDKRYHKQGVAKVFYTAHHAVDPDQTKKYLKILQEKGADHSMAPPILYHGRFYKTGEELKKAVPDLTCLI